MRIRDGRSHSFSLRLRSCSKIFETGYGSGNFSNLRIRLLFRLRLPSIQPKFNHVFNQEMTTQTDVTDDIVKWLRLRFWLRDRIRKNAKTFRSKPRHSGSMATSGANVPKGTPQQLFWCAFLKFALIQLLQKHSQSAISPASQTFAHGNARCSQSLALGSLQMAR